jgi:hypothetical protein
MIALSVFTLLVVLTWRLLRHRAARRAQDAQFADWWARDRAQRAARQQGPHA